MDLDDATGTQERFRAYVADLASGLGHADRVRPFEDYCIGLLSADGRKSVEPLAAVTAPERTAAQHQSLLHLVAQAPWSDQAVLARVRKRVLPSITREEAVQAWIVDDTGLVGKEDNCQVAVSLSLAKIRSAGRPPACLMTVRFQTKPQIALQQMRQAAADGVPPGVALMDPAYGNDSKLRAGISELWLTYVAGILPTTIVWRPGEISFAAAFVMGISNNNGTRLRTTH
jgi:SRSO17 transposase